MIPHQISEKTTSSCQNQNVPQNSRKLASQTSAGGCRICLSRLLPSHLSSAFNSLCAVETYLEDIRQQTADARLQAPEIHFLPSTMTKYKNTLKLHRCFRRTSIDDNRAYILLEQTSNSKTHRQLGTEGARKVEGKEDAMHKCNEDE